MQPSLPAPQESQSTPPDLTPSKRKRRSLFLPGFVLGFGMLMIASCSSVGIALGLNQLSLAELQGNGAAAWTPPPYTPAPTPLPVTTAAESSSAGSTRFAPQQGVRNLTNSRVNVRATPGYLSKPSGDVIGVMQPGATAVVLGASQATDNLVWWRVRVALDDGRTIEGWVAEATASGVQILGG